MVMITKFPTIKALNRRGFTMVEVLISMAIIALLAMTFIPLFSTNFVNIFAFGERDRAMSAASDIMERLYADQPYGSRGEIENKLDDLLTSSDSNFYDLMQQHIVSVQDYYQIAPESGFTDLDGVKGYRVLIDTYYQDGERSVTLTSFIRVRGEE